MKVLTGRFAQFLFAIPFIMFGLMDFVNAESIVETMIPDFIPAAKWLVYISASGLILGGIIIVIGFKARLAALIIALELLVFILIVWLPQLGVEEKAAMATNNLLKDIALLGGCLMLAERNEET